MKTECIIDCIDEKRKLFVRNVWNAKRLIELEFDGQKFVVHEAELRKAISNATDNEVR